MAINSQIVEQVNRGMKMGIKPVFPFSVWEAYIAFRNKTIVNRETEMSISLKKLLKRLRLKEDPTAQ